MGLDTVELVVATEETFNITFDDAELYNIRTVGEFHELILSKIENRSKKDEICISTLVFNKIRRTLVNEYGVSRENIHPDAKLNELFANIPTKDFALNSANKRGIKLPFWIPYRYKLLRDIIILCILIILGFQIYPIEHVLAVIVFIITIVYGLYIYFYVCDILKLHVPIETATIRDLVKNTALVNFKRHEGNIYRTFNKQEAWEELKRLIVDQTGVSPDEVVPSAEFIKDLGMD